MSQEIREYAKGKKRFQQVTAFIPSEIMDEARSLQLNRTRIISRALQAAIAEKKMEEAIKPKTRKVQA